MDIKMWMTRLTKRPHLAWVPFLVWVGMAFALSSQSSPPGAATIGAQAGGQGDVLVHLAEYAVGGILALFALALSGLSKRGWLIFLLAWLIVLAIACVDETIQRFVPGRTFSLTDVATDALGAGAALALVAALSWVYRAMHENS